MRTHPPTLLTLTKRTIREHALFARGDCVLVAVSGGRDSMALLHVLAWLRRDFGHTLVAHAVDHGLREDAAGEIAQAARFAKELEVPFAHTRVTVGAGGNLQARAREARYEALTRAAVTARADVLATAHHADDRAETLLLRLLRGAGPSGLAVLPPKTTAHGPLPRVRPFVHARRRAIEAHIARHRVPYADDPSNADVRFTRARVRHELVPLLETMNPRIVEHLAALADRLAEPRTSCAPLVPPLVRSDERTHVGEVVAPRGAPSARKK